ncbi:MAG: bifunctional proline dehydrogenase/L-glutamate gamma-semialdehyde dehydrogenase PutA [Holosporales bacterium]
MPSQAALHSQSLNGLENLRIEVQKAYRKDEGQCVQDLLQQISLTSEQRARIQSEARHLVHKIREKALHQPDAIDAFMRRYELSSAEGVLLMCLAEALLRIPDAATAEELIRDKLTQADFERHLSMSPSRLVNASTRAMLVAKKLLSDEDQESSFSGAVRKLLARSSEPLILRTALQVMRLLADKFVMGRTIEHALRRARKENRPGISYSYDMLGEAALTTSDAERYFESYRGAIRVISKDNEERGADAEISIKLSALHPRYEQAQADRVMRELVPSLTALCFEAKSCNVNLTIDAEESERLELSLDILEAVATHPELSGWNGLGVAVQAYQKRALYVIEWLAELARMSERKLRVRLVKGAYWDAEIKRAQERGLEGYAVYTRKSSTDLSFLVCAQRLLQLPALFYPAFATHNAQTLACILEMAPQGASFEFQKLHGMGDELYEAVLAEPSYDVRCRIYAPVGQYEDLLPYLVRRLLENGANTSFVNNIVNPQISVEDLIASPIDKCRTLVSFAHPKIPLPRDLFSAFRQNSQGLDLSDRGTLRRLEATLKDQKSWQATPLVAGHKVQTEERPVVHPGNLDHTVGTVIEADATLAQHALERASVAFDRWSQTSAETRARILERAADLLERDTEDFLYLLVHEGGKTLPDAMAEVREAVDFCRYYAQHGRRLFCAPQVLQGITGETNQLFLRGRGVFVCISPWNFPLAIFLGQVTAALMAGNTVVAKPARQTPLVAFKATQLLHEAGVPQEVLHFLPGSGNLLGPVLSEDSRVAGICFTGSTETAWAINQSLAKRPTAIGVFIAETGGQNCMLVDSSALPEQVVSDVIISAFQSAGQRCSALRVLMLQDDIAPRVLKLLEGAMAEVRVGLPEHISTDVGPVIDEVSLEMLRHHEAWLNDHGKLVARTPLDPSLASRGHFFAPCAYEIDNIHALQREVFGPILHIIRWRADQRDQVIDAINSTGYGLTFGLHTRIDRRIHEIGPRIKAGNIYVNRNMIGAVVGVQPFGGQGLSGTGPKAGGPHYLLRFAHEQTVSINTTAQGGNASLMSLQE